MDFLKALTIVRRRAWAIGLSSLLAMVLTFALTRKVGSRWLATVSLMTIPQQNFSDTQQNGNEYSSTDPVVAKSQAAAYDEIVKSTEVLAPALASLQESALPNDLLKNIVLQAVGRDTYELQVADSSPVRAGLMANAIADSFVARARELNQSQDAKLVHLLEAALHDTDVKLASARALDVAVHSGNATPDPRLEPALTRLYNLREQHDSAVAHAAALQAQLSTLTASMRGQTPPRTARGHRSTRRGTSGAPLASDPILGTLQTELAQAELQLDTLRKTLTDAHPDVQRQLAIVQDLQNRVATEEAAHPLAAAIPPGDAAAAATNWQQAQQQLSLLRQQVSASRAEVQQISDSLISAAADVRRLGAANTGTQVVSGEVQQLLQNRIAVAGRLHSARLSLDAATRQSPVVILNKVSPYNPVINSTPGRALRWIIAAGLAMLVLASALCVAVDTLDRRALNLEQAELAYPGPILTAIPQAGGSVTSAAMARASELLPQSPHAEAYRFLGLHLMRITGNMPRALTVVSTRSGQGCTRTACNLAITLAQAGYRVLLVDANLRKPGVHNAFNLQNDFGLSDLLSESGASIQRAIRPTTIVGLRVITAGKSADNCWALLNSERLPVLANSLQGASDFVVYDVAPAIEYTDAMLLAPVVQAAIICARALDVPSGEEPRLAEALQESGVAVLGTVLTDAPPSLTRTRTAEAKAVHERGIGSILSNVSPGPTMPERPAADTWSGNE
ncbi:MAG: polysaccharide biosynthesis tyrosine autokinase [Armatimonadetes bacterium]|nr:polysaccharide biosynthesis tyrosine autokinase [Armatimonadota bacterium]MDE2207622.1 polysaccharide biosynthesis tyrosine autokinase [Armatimonadota bacterium]